MSLGISSYAQFDIRIAKPLTTTKATVIMNWQIGTDSSIVLYNTVGNWDNVTDKISTISVVNIEDSSTIFEVGSGWVLEWLAF